MDSQTLQLWNVIGTWIASIGTVSAVITSLWFAYYQGKVKLNVSAGHRLLITQGIEERLEYCVIRVVNTSSKPAKVISIGWEAGRFKDKVHMLQVVGTPGSDSVPKMLQEGEEATFLLPFNLEKNEDDWIVKFTKYLNEGGKNRIPSLKVIINTSVGQTFKQKVEKNLLEELEKSFNANK